MIRKIILHNFMSHRHTIIEPAQGLTVLVGENNCGKSAVVAALQILCNNTGGDYMVRHGQSECRVILETDEGHVVEWRRNNGTVSYTLNGQSIYRLRGGTPDDLHKLLRMPLVCPQDGGDPFDVHFGEQKKPVFLLDESGGRAAKFFASSSDAEALIRMQILHKANIRDATQRSSQFQAQLERLDRRLQPLERVPNIQTRLDDLEDDYVSLAAMAEKVASLGQNIEDLLESTLELESLGTKARILWLLATPPRARDTESLSMLTESLTLWLGRHQHLESQNQTLGVLQVPPRLADTGALTKLAQDMTQASQESRHLESQNQTLGVLQVPPKLADTGMLAELTEDMTQATQEVRHFESQNQTLGVLRAPPKLADTGMLAELTEDMTQVSQGKCHLESQNQTLGVLRAPPKLADTEVLTELTLDMTQTDHEVRRVAETMGALAELRAAPKLTSTKNLESTCEEMLTCVDQTNYQSKKAACVGRLRTPPDLFDTDALHDQIAEIERLRFEARRRQAKSTALGRCKPPPELPSEKGLVELVGELERATSKAAAGQSVFETLAILGLPPPLIELSSLNELIGEFSAIQCRVKGCLKQLDGAESLVAGAEKAIRDWAIENPNCPTCGAKLDPERLVTFATSASEGHVHE